MLLFYDSSKTIMSVSKFSVFMKTDRGLLSGQELKMAIF